jgi:hypothetical protein
MVELRRSTRTTGAVGKSLAEEPDECVVKRHQQLINYCKVPCCQQLLMICRHDSWDDDSGDEGPAVRAATSRKVILNSVLGMLCCCCCQDAHVFDVIAVGLERRPEHRPKCWTNS